MKVLSFHPLFEADDNRLCAGREPDEADLAAIQAADAVLFSQGCKPLLYKMARDHLPAERVFPNYDARFAYPGKLGQIRLFRETGFPHPPSLIFADRSQWRKFDSDSRIFPFPLVFKFDWGGEGDTVFLLENPAELEAMLKKAARYEQSGQRGFLLQAFIPCENRSLRVAVVGKRLFSYWRVRTHPGFAANLSKGAKADPNADPFLQARGRAMARAFCRKTGINLAGLDFLFPKGESVPMLLEINYYFGRKGLGGSEGFYAALEAEIGAWMEALRSGVQD